MQKDKPAVKLKNYEKWLPYAAYRATGRFSGLGDGFVNHCGPTAITNAILTLQNKAEGIRSESDGKSAQIIFRSKNGKGAESDNELFLNVARFGMHHLFYYNVSLLHRFGGTSDVLTGFYLRSMLKKYVPGETHVSIPRPLTPRNMLKELSRGRFLYIQVLRHPKYKNHHFLCYGARKADPKEGGGVRFICSDGWSYAPKELMEKDFRFGSFRSIYEE